MGTLQDPYRPLLVRSFHDKSARLLLERASFGTHHIDGVRLTCIAEESDRCQGIFLQGSETVSVIVALLEHLCLGSLTTVVEAAHARHVLEAKRDADWIVSRDLRIDRGFVIR